MLWDLIISALTGGATEALLSGGMPSPSAVIGAATGAAARSVPPLIHDLGAALFGRGAFDLAKRVRREAMRVEYDALSKLLTSGEKSALGL